MLSDNSFGSSIRVWNDTPITRRDADGYVNATEMCRANGKQWKHFRENGSTELYLQALEDSVGIPTQSLIESRGGRNGGTWVHPEVATELARWISPRFSVFVNRWFREAVEAQNQTPTTPLFITPAQTLDLIERSYSMLERLGVADDRDRFAYGDMIRNTTARAAGGQLLAPVDEEMGIAEAWFEVVGEVLPPSHSSKVGKKLAALYRKEFQAEPPTRTQKVNGRPCDVKSYRRGWLLQAIQRLTNQLPES